MHHIEIENGFLFRPNVLNYKENHALETLLRQYIFSRLAGYEDVNDAARMGKAPAMRAIAGKKKVKKNAAGANSMGRFETEMLTLKENLGALSEINGRWVQRAINKTSYRRIILDMDSSESPVHGDQRAERAVNRDGASEKISKTRRGGVKKRPWTE